MLTRVIFVPSIPQHSAGRPTAMDRKMASGSLATFCTNSSKIRQSGTISAFHATNKQTHVSFTHRCSTFASCFYQVCITQRRCQMSRLYNVSDKWVWRTGGGILPEENCSSPGWGETYRSANSSVWDRTRASAVTAWTMVQHMTQQIGDKKVSSVLNRWISKKCYSAKTGNMYVYVWVYIRVRVRARACGCVY